MLTVKMDELHVGTFATAKDMPRPTLKKGRLAAKVVKLKRNENLYKAPPNPFEAGDCVRVADRSSEIEGRW